MDKGELIKKLGEIRDYIQADGDAAGWWWETIDFLLKQAIGEPITARALQKEEYTQSALSDNVYTKTRGNAFEMVTISVKFHVSPPKVLVFFNNANGTMIYPNATTMAHLHALEEMFLS